MWLSRGPRRPSEHCRPRVRVSLPLKKDSARTRSRARVYRIEQAEETRIVARVLAAQFEETEGPSTIRARLGERRIIVQTNVRGPRHRVVRRGRPKPKSNAR